MSSSALKTSLHHLYPCVYQRLLSGGYRTPLFNYSNNGVYKREWLRRGWPMFDVVGGVRSIHGTAATDTEPMPTRDFYQVLGVSRDVTRSEMKMAYYELAKELHPDKNNEDPEADQKFQLIQRAYEVLKDDETRAQYDQFGQDYGGGSDSFGRNPFHDIFGDADVFDRNIGGEDVKVSVELSFMEAVTGCTKNITFQADFSCGACGGTGTPPGTRPATCKRCKGSGVESDITSQDDNLTTRFDCPNCKGTGKIVLSFCKTCKGKGVTKGKKSAKLDLVPGLDNNDTLKICGRGGADPEGRKPGDLFVTVKVGEDPVFRRERSNIHVDIVLSITQAKLGATVQVPTLSGNTVLTVRPGTRSGQKVILKNKGIIIKKSHTFGDQYVHFKVDIPSENEKELKSLPERADDDQGAAAAAASG